MLSLESDDFGQLEEFPLAWRWTQESHALLSDEELIQIEPLKNGSAQKVSDFLQQLSAKMTLSDDQSLSTSTTSADDVAKWLKSLPVSNDAILVSWDPETAVRVAWPLFIFRWDDFCYPSSDDATIVPLDGGWLMSYFHWEEFRWGKTNAAKCKPNAPPA